MKKILQIFFIISSFALCEENKNATEIINKTEQRFRMINDYQVNMVISINIPAFRMPKKKYTVFFKQPNQVQIKSKGFGLLPRTGMFTPPSENFNNLTDVTINHTADSLGYGSVMLRGNLIVDSLAIKMPNDYAKLTFKPTVDVVIDTSQWVITRVITKIDTIKIMEINNIYDFVDGSYFLPIRSTVEYFVKDARISKWLKKDIGTIIGNQQSIDPVSDMVRGEISVTYNKYKVNRGINDSIFKK
ncbi:MAG: hypothetical protein CMF90_06190 [Candidatus Marinimicrobia bacterium]|jgi:hypothetical protein|nr:hypothetical protein [Candidatus Neomarinimicrobiota bacterium]MEC7622458.1 hypothetical protein [Candidatus Neomarinimicrobiota bacterium]MEC7902003.1 hypothetical protein [Candidatus Neomarinimicrobiota bacterium]|tara:strand:+ start:254 stop:988 length:735 start_codon:yes stop_codon:yes gene_type:complete